MFKNSNNGTVAFKVIVIHSQYAIHISVTQHGYE